MAAGLLTATPASAGTDNSSAGVRLVSSAGVRLVSSAGVRLASSAEAPRSLGGPSRAVAGPATGAYVAVTPSRLADTRYGTGTAKAKIPAGGTLVLPVAGRAGVPATGAAAVAVDINVVNAGVSGRLTAWAAGSSRPGVASVNFSPGTGSLALVVSALSAAGSMALWNSSTRPIDVIVDVSGYFVGGGTSTAGGFVAVTPSRSLDTRSGLGASRSDWRDVVDGYYSALSWQVSGRNAVPVGATAVVMSLTATNATNTGQLVALDDDPSFSPGIDPALTISDGYYVPVTGTAFKAGWSVTNTYVVPLSEAGRAQLNLGYDGATPGPGADLVGDVVGYISGGGAQTPGTYQPLPVGQLPGVTVPARGTVDVTMPVAAGADVSLSVTASDAGSSGGLVIFQQGTARPAVRSLNFAAGQRVSNTVLVHTSAASKVSISNTSGSPVSVTIDLLGYFRSAATLPAGTVWSSGANSAGGMGLGFASDGSSVPAPVGLAGVREVTSSAGSSYAVTADGSLWSWGRNNDPETIFEGGQLGLGNTQNQLLPVKVPGLTDVVDIDADYPRGYALLGDGTVWEWGGQDAGEVDSPMKVDNLSGVVSLDHGYAVKANGSLWSVSYVGTFEDGCPDSGCFTATIVTDIVGVAQIEGQLVLRTDGVLESWTPGTAPVVITNITGVKTLTDGAVLLTDGTVWIPPTDGSQTAAQVPGLTGVTTLGALAVKADGSVWRYSTAGATRLTNLPPAAQVPPAANLVVAR